MTREEAIKELEYILVGHPETSARGKAVRMAIEALAIMEAWNPPEQKKGKWISSGIGTICSNCYYKLETTGLLSRCPNCEAKMEGWE